jgi:hypothetical protein
VITATPPDDDELLGAQLATLQRKRDQAERERGRLLDAYQAALLDLNELMRRTAALTARRDQLVAEHAQLTARRHDLDFDGRQRFLRMVVEKSASPAGASRSTSRSPSPTMTHNPTRARAAETRPGTVKRYGPAFR